ncbi:MAG: transglycosylase SLT domain-containing protein [Gallionella sp.]|nr:transglycosylase SLT domain-containing protein [Gallionella sp.]
MKFILIFLLLLPASSWADVDADFTAAREAFRVGNSAKLALAAARLKQTPLEPYATYYLLRMRWEDKDSKPIKAFLAREEDTPVIDQLRAEWLKMLGRKQRWEEFAGEYPNLINADAELTCYALQLQYKTDEEAALREVRKLWPVGTSQADSCNVLFESALKKDIITAQDVSQRVRLALESGNTSLAKKLIPKMRNEERLPIAELDAAARNPQRYLSKTAFTHASDGRRRVALYALQRLAKQSADVAHAQYQKIATLFPESEKQYFYSWLALAAAKDHDPRALEWYGRAGEAALSEQQLAWRTRAALRARNWHEVWAGIAAMAPQQQNEGTWRYWNARALKELGHAAEAEAIWAPLSREYNFYGQLAAEELGASPAAGMVSASFQPTAAELEMMQSRPEIRRTLILYRLGMRVEAAKEWDWAMRGLSDRELLVASEVARRDEMYDRSINAANRTVELHDFNLRYPSPYREAMQAPLHEHDLEEAWVYGLMRQESRFASHAKSDVGAAGLMQIMPATAKWAARRIGLKGYRKGLIHQLDVNLRLGTYYMKNVFNQFDDNPVLASAAYNAGPARARRWRGDVPLEGAIYAETIPFDETRDYVKKVMSNTIYYAKLFGQPSESLKKRLGVIKAHNSVNQQADPDEI